MYDLTKLKINGYSRLSIEISNAAIEKTKDNALKS